MPSIWYFSGGELSIYLLEIRIMNTMSWFVGYYFVLMVLVGKFLNNYLFTISKQAYQEFLLVSLAIIQFTFSGSLADGLTNGLRIVLTGVFLYALGGYIRLYDPWKYVKRCTYYVLVFLTFALVWLSSYNVTMRTISYYFQSNNTNDFVQPIPTYENWSMVVIIVGVCLFEIFRHINISCNKTINFLGKSTFMVYLLHDNNFFYSIWDMQDWITLLFYRPYWFIVKLCLWAGGVFVVGFLGYILYDVTGKAFEKYSWILLKK